MSALRGIPSNKWGSEMNYNTDGEIKICSLVNCENEVDGWRSSRKHPTCSTKCTATREGNKQTAARAKKYRRATAQCIGDGCSRLIIVSPDREDLCRTCGQLAGRMRGPKVEAVGKYHRDFRTDICLRDNKQCINFSACSDSVAQHKQGAFKYQLNGGVDCYEEPPASNRMPKGSTFAVHTANHG